MNKVLNSIQSYAKELKKRKHDFLPSPTIAVTKIQGGKKTNIVPSNCEITIDRRLIPGETKEEALKDLKDMFEEIKKDDTDFSYLIKVKKKPSCYPAILEPNSKFLKEIKYLYCKYFNTKIDAFDYFRASCEQVFFLRKGIDTVIFGPGDISQAHTENEFVDLIQLYKAASFYAFCILNQQ